MVTLTPFDIVVSAWSVVLVFVLIGITVGCAIAAEGWGQALLALIVALITVPAAFLVVVYGVMHGR